MPIRVCIDTMICIWGVQRKANPNQENKLVEASSLFTHLANGGYDLYLPAPVLAEFLSPLSNELRLKALSEIQKGFKVLPFDTAAAIKASELWSSHNKSRAGERIKLKQDVLIAAVAISREINILITEDPDYTKLCMGTTTGVNTMQQILNPSGQIPLFQNPGK